MRNAYKLCSLVCFSSALAFIGCGSSGDDSSSGPTGGRGGTGGAGGSAGKGGSSGTTNNAGGTSNSAGSSNVAGQSSGGSAGAAVGGSGGGSAAGTGGGASGGAAGNGGSSAGTGGSGVGGTGGSGGVGGTGGTSGSGGTGGTAGSGGASGSSGSGGTSGSGSDAAGASGSDGDAAGAGNTSCPTPAFIDLFDFADGSKINSNPDGTASAATNPGEAKGQWSRSRYGSTANGVAGQDGAANNLAKLTTLTFEATDGNPTAGSMKASAPFVGSVNETLGIVYNIAPYQDVADLANVSGRQFTAKVRLVSTSRDVCVFSATAWSTADSQSTAGTTFLQSNGTPVTLTVGDWVTATFDLDNSADKTRVNQVGLDIKSTCTGTATGTAPTVIEVDHATLGCK